MNTNQSWIKYLAIAFGLVLALGIISTIVNGGLTIMKGFGLIENEVQLVDQGKNSFSQKYTGDLKSVYINFNVGSVTLQSGDVFQVEGTNISSNLTAELDNGQLVIEDKQNSNFLSNLFGPDKVPTLVVTIPKNTQLQKLDLELGAGRGELSQISTNELNLKQGAGEIVAKQLKANSGQLKGGAGAVDFSDVSLNNFEIKGGVGLINIQGIMTGDMGIKCGVGQTSLDINGNIDDYFITADQGVGSITINGQGIPENGIGSKSAPNRFDINGGVGPVSMTFN